ncbi:MAG: O-antigen ligase family protein [Chloroflexi bacterium]|nr:O-antigen ligase family protein [Chloroflexota bacterium]
MIPRRVKIAMLLALIGHGIFILTARYRLSYDAFTHMLFADHYASDWFSLWETRWYTGFEVVSYPPLTHQLISIFSFALGFEKAYALVLWIVTTMFPLGIYAFSRIFAGRSASSYAALASALLLPIYITAHIFGQLPFLTATLFALFGAAALARYLREGGAHNFLLAVSLAATTMAAHHATLMIQPFFFLAVIVKEIDQENWRSILKRTISFSVLAIPASLAVIWPFWQWGMGQEMQTPIDHLSRHNFFANPMAAQIFFWPFYLPIGAVIPFIFYKWGKNFLGLQFSFIVLFILGLGGTTSLPALLFGKGWEWLTYDRFVFWATLTLLPFFGILFLHFHRRMKTRIARAPLPASLRTALIPALTFFVFACAALGSWFTPYLFPVQPDPITMQPIVDFLDEQDHSDWRYLTFGFGDQFAYLNLLTTATTIDGSYHTARSLPELRESGIGQIDTALWTSLGIPAIAPILETSGGHGVRWGFVNRKEYLPQLRKSSWEFVKILKNGIQVWENPKAVLPELLPPPVQNPFESFSWGVFPLLSFVATISLGGLRIWPNGSEKIMRGLHAFVVGLIPVSLCFWYYKLVGAFEHKQVYFTYDHALFFLSDGFMLLAVVLWIVVQAASKNLQPRNIFRASLLVKLMLALCVLISLSVFWSADWRTSLYLSVHFWVGFALMLSLRDWNQNWKAVLLGLSAALTLQIFTALIGFYSQSTAFLEPLQLNWPGLLEPFTKGASILNLPNGELVLRAYGTLPHPNILGGLILLCLLGPVALFLRKERPNWFALFLIAAGSHALVLTFSRSAWLALAAFVAILFLKSKFLGAQKTMIVIGVIIATFALTLFPLRAQTLSRVSSASTTELAVTGRFWLIEHGLKMTSERPFTGVGIGSFIILLAKREGQYNFVEPVHNIPLLALTELGLAGFLLLAWVAIEIGRRIYRMQQPNAILISAVLAGIGIIALLDHYFWTLAPGRIMLSLAVGLWLGENAHAS